MSLTILDKYNIVAKYLLSNVNKTKGNNYDNFFVKNITQSMMVDNVDYNLLTLPKSTKFIIVTDYKHHHNIYRDNFINNLWCCKKGDKACNTFKMHLPTVLMKLVALKVLNKVKNIVSVVERYIKKNPNSTNFVNENGNTALHILLYHFNINDYECRTMALALINAIGDDYPSKNNLGLTPLHIFCKRELPLDILEALVKKIDINAVDNNGYSAFALLQQNKISIIDEDDVSMCLLKAGAKFSFDDLRMENISKLKQLLKSGVINLNSVDEYGESLLSFAVKNGNDEMVKYLIDHGANSHLINVDGLKYSILTS